MTRKDYVAIAEAIDLSWRHNLDLKPEYAVKEVTCRIADVMDADNPRFDREKFLKACGF